MEAFSWLKIHNETCWKFGEGPLISELSSTAEIDEKTRKEDFLGQRIRDFFFREENRGTCKGGNCFWGETHTRANFLSREDTPRIFWSGKGLQTLMGCHFDHQESIFFLKQNRLVFCF